KPTKELCGCEAKADGVYVGNIVMLNVSPWKGIIRFSKRGKLSPRYVRPFKIIERIGVMAYRLELTEKIHAIHNMFHVSNHKKCLADENLVIPLEEIQLDNKFHFIEEPMEIMDRKFKRLKQIRIPIVNVCWNSWRGPEFIWEREYFFMTMYSHLFPSKKRSTLSPVECFKRCHLDASMDPIDMTIEVKAKHEIEEHMHYDFHPLMYDCDYDRSIIGLEGDLETWNDDDDLLQQGDPYNWE
nr:putative reverse transcriptase domain-containing protein [Tanacetum cinerariifolium]